MKLYYSPGACSLSPHIALREAGLAFTPVIASTKTKKLADGSDYLAVNPKGQVPVLELDNGERLTEGPAIVQYIADQAPASKLAPPAGTMARYRLIEWLNFITTFTVADAYLYTVSRWGAYVGVDLSGLPRLAAYRARVEARPAVQEALRAEGLLK
ncbi:MAG: glutathione S-transferase N-terminal domain-containing protein [Ideonella sp.]|nr:glutathione S-transferase N-terminal domain-containing protein [Ideonella sp.]